MNWKEDRVKNTKKIIVQKNRGVKMDKKRVLKIVNLILALSFILTAVPGLIKVIFPDIIPYSVFYTFHTIFGIVMLVFAILHIILNWSWIRVNFGGKQK